MALLSVRLYGDPILRTVAARVREVTPEIRQIVADMTETMWHQVGIGLAAPQVGVGRRILVMDDGQGGARALINPVIEERRGTVLEEEGCLSLPGVFAEVERSKWVRVAALDGILFIDRLPPVQRDRIKKKIQKEGFPKEPAHHAFAL
jgi:peptide deformylase